jgi:hypothetical protein
MRAHNAAINNAVFHVRVIGKMLMQVFPDALVAPAGKPLVDAVPVAIPRWQLAPLGTAAHDPMNSLQEVTARLFCSRIHARTLAKKLVQLYMLIIAYFRHLGIMH